MNVELSWTIAGFIVTSLGLMVSLVLGSVALITSSKRNKEITQDLKEITQSLERLDQRDQEIIKNLGRLDQEITQSLERSDQRDQEITQSLERLDQRDQEITQDLKEITQSLERLDQGITQNLQDLRQSTRSLLRITETTRLLASLKDEEWDPYLEQIQGEALNSGYLRPGMEKLTQPGEKLLEDSALIRKIQRLYEASPSSRTNVVIRQLGANYLFDKASEKDVTLDTMIAIVYGYLQELSPKKQFA